MEATDERFDLALMDLTDPDTPASALYAPDSLACAARAGAGRRAGAASGRYLHGPVAELVRSLRQQFAVVRCRHSIFRYGAYWGLAVASDELDPLELKAQQVAERLQAAPGCGICDNYNEQVHGALFALPNYYRELLK